MQCGKKEKVFLSRTGLEAEVERLRNLAQAVVDATHEGAWNYHSRKVIRAASAALAKELEVD
jgi:hypothetical protein